MKNTLVPLLWNPLDYYVEIFVETFILAKIDENCKMQRLSAGREKSIFRPWKLTNWIVSCHFLETSTRSALKKRKN